MNTPRNIALLLAGGSGVRMNAVLPKQFMEVDGETVLLHTMRAFQQHPLIHGICVVCQPEWEPTVSQEAALGSISKLIAIVPAGENSFLSAQNGIAYLSEHYAEADTTVLVHDAVRPLISQDIISRNIAVCLTHGNAITALPSHEAYLVTQDATAANDFLPREGLMRAQTPHTFPLSTLTRMMQEAHAQGITASQSLFTLAGELGIKPLYVAQGELRNFKITEQTDILLYRALKTLDE